MLMALEVDSYEEVADRIRGFLDMQAPQGLLDKLKMLPETGRARRVFPEDREVRSRARKSSAATISRWPSFRSCSAGRRTPAASSPGRW